MYTHLEQHSVFEYKKKKMWIECEMCAEMTWS